MATLRELRTRLYMTQVELAERVGVSEPTIVSWETGQRVPRLRNIPKLAEALGVEPAEVEQALQEQALEKRKAA